jgi:hypothetical protein
MEECAGSIGGLHGERGMGASESIEFGARGLAGGEKKRL